MDSSPYDASHFSPHDVSILNNIRSAQDLADFNAFMLSLGKDAASSLGLPGPPRQPHRQNSGDMPSPYSSGSSMSESQGGHDMFDPATLASLGLAGMPGIPNSGHVDFGSIYPNDNKIRTASDLGGSGSRPIAALPGARSGRDRQPDGSDLGNADDESLRKLASSLSGGSMPTGAMGGKPFGMGHDHNGLGGNNTFDFTHALNAMQKSSHNHSHSHSNNNSNFANFDQLAKPHSTAPPAKLDLGDFGKNTYRNVNLLGASQSQSSRTNSLDYVKREPISRGGSPMLVDINSLDVKREGGRDGEAYSPPLPKGAFPQAEMNPKYVLPALRHSSEKPSDVHLTGLRNLGFGEECWTASPAHSAGIRTRSPSPDLESDYGSGETRHKRFSARLPSITALLGPERKRSYDEALVLHVGRMGLNSRPPTSTSRSRAASWDERYRHAQIVRDLLVRVNNAWKRRHELGFRDEEYDCGYESEDDLRTPIAPRRIVEEEDEDEEDVKPVVRW